MRRILTRRFLVNAEAIQRDRPQREWGAHPVGLDQRPDHSEGIVMIDGNETHLVAVEAGVQCIAELGGLDRLKTDTVSQFRPEALPQPRLFSGSEERDGLGRRRYEIGTYRNPARHQYLGAL